MSNVKDAVPAIKVSLKTLKFLTKFARKKNECLSTTLVSIVMGGVKTPSRLKGMVLSKPTLATKPTERITYRISYEDSNMIKEHAAKFCKAQGVSFCVSVYIRSILNHHAKKKS